MKLTKNGAMKKLIELGNDELAKAITLRDREKIFDMMRLGNLLSEFDDNIWKRDITILKAFELKRKGDITTND